MEKIKTYLNTINPYVVFSTLVEKEFIDTNNGKVEKDIVDSQLRSQILNEVKPKVQMKKSLADDTHYKYQGELYVFTPDEFKKLFEIIKQTVWPF